LTATPRARGRIPVLAVTLSALLASACTQFTPYRTRTLLRDGTPNGVTFEETECFAGGVHATWPLCEGHSSPGPGECAVQHRHYRYTDQRADGTQELREGDYHLAFVEFDDQGWFADRKQMEALFLMLAQIAREQKERTGKDGHALIFLYAHGWKHNAGKCDNNVLCFSRLLERMDILERNLRDALPEARASGSSARAVVGVYVGWRGLSFDDGPLTDITFWTRKATGERVGRGGVVELLTRLNNYRALRNPSRDEDKTQLVIAGHSFGGLVIYSALSHALMERASTVDRFAAPSCRAVTPFDKAPDGLMCYDTARSFGDLIVLVNPAFEGSAYEPLFHIATNRCYTAWQRPVMITVTSSADDATGRAFPFGRALSTAFEHRGSCAQGNAMLKTVGHDTRYETHRLKWNPTSPRKPAEPESTSPGAMCDCPYLEPTSTFNWREFVSDLRPAMRATKSSREPPARITPRETRDGWRSYDLYSRDVTLEGSIRYSANYPYLVVTADREVIPDHNSIYTEPFMRFLHSFFLLHIASRNTFDADGCFDRDVRACSPGGFIPCEESCRLSDGSSCSGRQTDGLPGVAR